MVKDKKEKTPNISKKLSKALKIIEKKFGKDTIIRGNSEDLVIKRNSSGIKEFDEMLGGGFPRGMIMELYGPESGGKSTLLLKHIAKAQKNGLICAYIDAEKALDLEWSKKLGVDIDSLIHTRITDADNVFDILKQLLISKGVDVIVVDSVAALTPRKEIEDDMNKKQMALLARTVNKGLRVVNTMNERKGSEIIFINQLRSKVGMVFGNPDTTPGGRGMAFFAAIRVSIRRGEWFPNRKERIGFEMICRAEKNKTAMPYKEARFVFLNETGKIITWEEAKELKKTITKEEIKEED